MIPKFSIIIPVYNVAPYLRECLDSILAQSFTGWEAICVDDGSTDASGAILDEYKEKVERLGGDGQRTGKFVVIHQKNAGVSAARNAALDIVRGEWILFLDSDDLYANGFLGFLSSLIESSPGVDGVKFGYAELVQASELNAVSNSGTDTAIYDISKIVPQVVHQTAMWQCAYRASTLGRLRFNTSYKDGEDNLFARTFFISQAKSVAVTSAACYGYRYRPGSQIHRAATVKSLSDHINHRIDVLKVADAAHREVSGLYDSPWMVRFFTGDILLAILGQKRSDRIALLKLWRSKLRYLSSVLAISRCEKMIFCLCASSYLFCRIYMLRWRFRIWYDESPLSQRIRKLVRYVKCSGEYSCRHVSVKG